MLNLVITLKLLAQKWTHCTVKFYCNNLAVVQVVNTGKTKDEWLALALRNIWLILATYDIALRIKHIKLSHNVTANMLYQRFSEKAIDNVLYTKIKDPCIWHKIPIHFLKYKSFHIISGASTASSSLLQTAWTRRQQAYGPSTASAHLLHFRIFLAYLIFMDLPIVISVHNILTFVS